MDNYDCFISDSDIKPSYLSSPGLSSGYNSSDESHQNSKFTLGESVVGGARDIDSPWCSQSPFTGILAGDPCLSGTSPGAFGGNNVDMGGRSGELSSSVDYFSEFKSSLNFDDIKDMLWDPFVEVSRDFNNSCETLVDVDMMDSSDTRGGLAGSLTNSYSGGSESNLMSLLRGQDWMSPPNTGQNFGYSTSGQAGLNKFNKDMNSTATTSAATNQQPSQQKSIRPRTSSISHAMSSIQQHMANVNDIGSVSDGTDYILQIIEDSYNEQATPTTQPIPVPVPNKPQLHNSTILGGVFGQRSPMTTLKPCEPKALTRIKGGTVASSCGSLLRHSVTIPASLHQQPQQISSTVLGKCASEFNMKNGVNGLTPLSRNGERSASTCDMRGGKISNAYPGLDDHRYTLKPMSNPPNKSKMRKSPTSYNNSNSSLCSLNGGPVKSMSILEAFLRSTRPMDPNKGSNAALAAEGLSYLRIEDKQKREIPEMQMNTGRNSSGMLLKKLLTGEIDQSQVLQNEEQTIQDRLLQQTLPVDSPLTDGFGLDVDLVLDDAQIMDSMNLLSDTDVPDLTDNIWLGDIADELAVSGELDEILREQLRQDDLWLEHYIDNKPV